MKSNEKPNQITMDAWHDDPNNWKLGVFYYNKLDKRILMPKRIRYMGWTVNFANPYSYLSVFGVIALAVIISKFIK